MQYLLEHEYGYDTDAIGFPSISGCHAIVYQTTGGLFGFHNAGGSAEDTWATRAQGFAGFVQKHLGNGSGLQLYGCSFVGDNRRGYTMGKVMKHWKEELKEVAAVLGYKGKIRGYDLAATGIEDPGSAYVEYQAADGQCDIYVKQWTDTGKTLGVNKVRHSHQKRVGATPDQVITNVDRTSLIQVIPEVL